MSTAGERRNIAGRDQPRNDTPVVHDVRFWGNLRDHKGIFAECAPCQWAAGLAGGHTAGELLRLAEQHCGIPS
jgi:hypothetical protein